MIFRSLSHINLRQCDLGARFNRMNPNSPRGSPRRSLGRLGPPAKGTPRVSDASAEFATSVNVGFGPRWWGHPGHPGSLARWLGAPARGVGEARAVLHRGRGSRHWPQCMPVPIQRQNFVLLFRGKTSCRVTARLPPIPIYSCYHRNPRPYPRCSPAEMKRFEGLDSIVITGIRKSALGTPELPDCATEGLA
jgi:hypothetical protein